jgi:hypothetical protein
VNTAPQQQGCSLPNLLLPLVLAGGGYAGWTLSSPHGVVVGLLGAAAGAVLAIPAFALALLCVLGPLFLREQWTRRSRPKP